MPDPQVKVYFDICEVPLIQAAESTWIKQSYRTYWPFSFHSDNWKKFTISLQKLVIFNICHVFTPFVKHPGCRFLSFFTLCDIRNEAVFLILEHSSLRGLNRKKHKENHENLAFKLLLQEIRLVESLSSRKIFWSSNIYALK